MKKKPVKRSRLDKLIIALLLLLVLMVALAAYYYGFAGPSGLPAAPAVPTAAVRPAPTMPKPATPDTETLPVTTTPLGETLALDTSTTADGYIQARCDARRKAYVVLEKDGAVIRDFLPTDGRFHVVPLTLGDGLYTARISLNSHGDTYVRMLETAFETAITDPLVRFTLPIPLAQFDEETAAVQVATAFYRASETDLEFVEAVYDWVAEAAEYDDQLMEVAEGIEYQPDLDRVVAQGRAICADFASLYAAMLRACGIPCQIVYGYVETLEGVRYHAWNLVWLVDEHGEGKWWRYDPTLGASRTDPDRQNSEPVFLRGNPVYGEIVLVH